MDNKFIKIDNRIITMASAWKITGITTEDKGLKHLYLEKDLFNTSYDDVENEVADRWQYETKPTVSPTPPIEEPKPEPTPSPEETKPLEYKLNQNMGFSIHRWNTNTFWASKLVNGKDVPCEFKYNITGHVDPKNVALKLVDGKVKIRNLSSENGSIYLIVSEGNKEVLKQEITLLSH